MRKSIVAFIALAFCAMLASCASPTPSAGTGPVYVRPGQGPVIPNPFEQMKPKGY